MKMSLEGLWVPTCFSRGLVARKPLFCSSDLSPPKKSPNEKTNCLCFAFAFFFDRQTFFLSSK